MTRKSTLPQNVEVIVIGGGVVGCSIAYHLAKKNVNTVLLERKSLTCGTTGKLNSENLMSTLRRSRLESLSSTKMSNSFKTS